MNEDKDDNVQELLEQLNSERTLRKSYANAASNLQAQLHRALEREKILRRTITALTQQVESIQAILKDEEF